jgi:hypothetical protein
MCKFDMCKFGDKSAITKSGTLYVPCWNEECKLLKPLITNTSPEQLGKFPATSQTADITNTKQGVITPSDISPRTRENDPLSEKINALQSALEGERMKCQALARQCDTLATEILRANTIIALLQAPSLKPPLMPGRLFGRFKPNK